jgi:hypothetical protein
MANRRAMRRDPMDGILESAFEPGRYIEWNEGSSFVSSLRHLPWAKLASNPLILGLSSQPTLETVTSPVTRLHARPGPEISNRNGRDQRTKSVEPMHNGAARVAAR